MIEVKAKGKAEGSEATVNYNFGENLAEATELFGEGPVFDAFRAQAKVNLQAGLRRCLDTGRDPVAFAAAWKPGVKAPSIAQDPMAAATAAFSKMSAEERAAFLKSLKG